jgi:hypothetical protein
LLKTEKNVVIVYNKSVTRLKRSEVRINLIEENRFVSIEEQLKAWALAPKNVVKITTGK